MQIGSCHYLKLVIKLNIGETITIVIGRIVRWAICPQRNSSKVVFLPLRLRLSFRNTTRQYEALISHNGWTRNWVQVIVDYTLIETGPDFGEQTKHKISYRSNGIACSIHYGFVFYIPHCQKTVDNSIYGFHP